MKIFPAYQEPLACALVLDDARAEESFQHAYKLLDDAVCHNKFDTEDLWAEWLKERNSVHYDWLMCYTVCLAFRLKKDVTYLANTYAHLRPSLTSGKLTMFPNENEQVNLPYHIGYRRHLLDAWAQETPTWYSEKKRLESWHDVDIWVDGWVKDNVLAFNAYCEQFSQPKLYQLEIIEVDEDDEE